MTDTPRELLLLADRLFRGDKLTPAELQAGLDLYDRAEREIAEGENELARLACENSRTLIQIAKMEEETAEMQAEMKRTEARLLNTLRTMPPSCMPQC
jgi:septal ring factor EnvC (AmiA/AmiB activator)